MSQFSFIKQHQSSVFNEAMSNCYTPEGTSQPQLQKKNEEEFDAQS